MNYVIKCVPGQPSFDTLGVIKLGCAQSVPINERIYGQAQLGRNEDSLFVRVLSFEPKPVDTARLSAVFCLGSKTLQLSVMSNGQAEARCENDNLTSQMTAYITQGEDLQGEYWAGVMLFPLKGLFAALGADKNALPLNLSGNILRENPALSSAAPLNDTVRFTLK
ncbi:MAG TPA: hypothetical protein VN626_05495 [Clostridia bacterium]|nr:hypothetical protein [Clostridia bacterium]